MIFILAAAAIAAAQPAAATPPASPHAGHHMAPAPDALKGAECSDCKMGGDGQAAASHKGMAHEGMKGGGCCCCKDMPKGHHDHHATGTTGA